MRIYVDGPFGVGKTTTIRALTDGAFDAPVLVVKEPMKYWRCFFTDLVSAVYDTSERARAGELSEHHVSAIMASIQARFSDPFTALHERVANRFGFVSGIIGQPDMVLVFDRHPLASVLCFPLARYLLGECSVEMVLSLSARLPHEPPGGNMLIADLEDEEEHVRRLTRRARPGEIVNVNTLRAIRVVYNMFINTVDYAASLCRYTEGEWEDDWCRLPWFEDGDKNALLAPDYVVRRPQIPSAGATILAILKRRELCDSDGNAMRVHAWRIEAILRKIRHLHVGKIRLDGKTSEECVSAFRNETRDMIMTRVSFNDLYAIEADVEDFNRELGAADDAQTLDSTTGRE
uniref:Thymidine kinase n=1 Tax=Anatid alphaherpesvirus 2 TaxID=3080522 RepID=A0AAU0K6N8_9ALPH